MDKQQIEAKLIEYFEQEYPQSGIALNASTDLLSNYITDSLRVISTIIFLESSFDLDIHEGDLSVEILANITNLANFVLSKLESDRKVS